MLEMGRRGEEMVRSLAGTLFFFFSSSFWYD